MPPPHGGQPGEQASAGGGFRARQIDNQGSQNLNGDGCLLMGPKLGKIKMIVGTPDDDASTIHDPLRLKMGPSTVAHGSIESRGFLSYSSPHPHPPSKLRDLATWLESTFRRNTFSPKSDKVGPTFLRVGCHCLSSKDLTSRSLAILLFYQVTKPFSSSQFKGHHFLLNRQGSKWKKLGCHK